VACAAERDERRRDERRFVDGRLVTLAKPASEPAGGDPSVPTRILERDQRCQLQRFDQGDPADLTQRVLGDEKVAALDRPLVGRPRMTLVGRACLSGAGRRSDPSCAAAGVALAAFEAEDRLVWRREEAA
jgi:hypothetical protein